MTWAELLASEFAITIANGQVWASIRLAILLAACCWLFGTWVARTVGLLDVSAPAGEVVGVGLACGLMVITAWWAALWSGGRSSFTPVAIGFVLALTLAALRRRRTSVLDPGPPTDGGRDDAPPDRPSPARQQLVTAAILSTLFVAGVALLYGSTIAPSPRDGVQPVIERDTAFYAILGRDLARTGTETTLSPSGFSNLPDFPVQVWYHWGELWLSSAVITIFGVAPMAARHFIVLPVILLAAAALAGTLVRRVNRTNSWVAYGFGFTALLVFGPVSLDPMRALSAWAVGLVHGIALYGMGATAALLAMYFRAVMGDRKATWPLAAFVGSGACFILPAHIAIAILGGVGVAAVGSARILGSLTTERRLPRVAPIWLLSLTATAAVMIATVAWGLVTGHGLDGTSAPASTIAPFSSGWRETVVLLVLGAGAFVAIPVSAWRTRRQRGPVADLCLGVMALLIAGAIGWGARLSEFTMFYLLFAGIAVYATPVAAAAVWSLICHLRLSGHGILAVVLAALCVIQLQIGVKAATVWLQALGVATFEPIPTTLLQSIAELPGNARMAYSCGPAEEIAFGVPQLLTVDVVTARRVIPMCFEPEFPSILLGAKPNLTIPSQFFRRAPQMELYPTSTAAPTPGAILAFLRKYDIGYIYADARHPNTLVPDAVIVASSGDAQVLRVP